ncbi:ribokinase [Micractinium conductrix]|uniref:Ribokinase n=1 Tax=Micractinium conductrix TaxID=554055 RepID=A0A2P6VJU5_9CHLO|nr:ribokinase [Micractinium conductrix]|eukprot:PSC74376.1 ribokinase [Micractinium conductrix]
MAQLLAVAGSLNADLVFSLQRVPRAGETLAARGMTTMPGGKGGNQAAAAARLGCPTKLVAQVGRDAQAGMLRAALEGCGVDTGLVKDVEGATGTAVILLEEDGDNRIVIHGGANTAPWSLGGQERAALTSAGAVLLQREIPEAVNLELAQMAHAAGVPVVLDAGGASDPLSPELLRCLAVLSPNETELQGLTGMPTDTDEQIAAAAQALQAQGVGTVLVKLGARGSLLVESDGRVVRQPARKVEKVVDTTGAGDCFTAAFVVALLEGRGHAEAMRFATAAAALCIQVAGAMPSMPSRQQVEAELAAAA